MTLSPALTLTDREKVRDELARQYEILEREKWQRIILTSFAYALCALFTDPSVMAIFVLIDILAEVAALRLLRGLDPAEMPGRYRASILAVIIMEAVIATAAGLVWLADDPYAKALAAGLAMTTLLQLSTVRSIHLPYGLAGLVTVGLIVMGFNLAHWIDRDSMVGLVISLAAGLGGIAYALTAMWSNNSLHRASAEGAAAARASDAAKSLFLAQMSHELRTPLNAIIGLGEVEAAAATGTSQDRLRTIVTSARGLAVVLDDVLDLSAITDGRVAILPGPTDLRLALKTTVGVFAPEAERGGSKLSLILPEDLPSHVLLDAQRLRQCLTNLIGNALKHAGGSCVRITARHHGTQLDIEVADDGPGVPAALAEDLFQPFRRGGNAVPGLGLGLAISWTLARQMGGDLVHVPTPKGAVFRLELSAPVSGPPPELAMPDLTGRCILIVDDIATNRLVASGLVQSLGADAMEAEGGAEALRIVAETPVDLVLLDMAMPGMDGFETFRRLRAGPGRAVPVVAMTAGAMADQRAAVLAAGLDGFVAKPLLPEALGAILGPLLIRRTAGNKT
ncbi:response regulator [Tabrizicola sp.]|uniref:response regulator n=1 Tax=Tabrizicola sp. TaxID=2005166 RepID=UPI002611D6AC|nr:response regulator [Tabrizicola sp.]MDM7931998.1 response regulator [Tabrizicola sp.]